ncbi:MAG: hypothetical protein ACQEWG_11810 [Bacteroidota bacterium]
MRKKLFIILALAVIMFQSCVTMAPNIEKGFRNTPEGYATEPAIPMGVVTNETTAQQLQLAKDQGQAVQEALSYLLSNTHGAEMSAGPYQIGFFMEKPKEWYEIRNNEDEFHTSEGNAFISVVVRDGYDGRIVPGLIVKAKLLRKDSTLVVEKDLPYGLHPLLNRYGANLQIPKTGDYLIKIEVEPAQFWRHDPINGDRYTDNVIALFNSRNISTSELRTPEIEENKDKWMPLAKAQGNAIKRAVDEMITKTAMDGEQIKYGPFLLTYAVEYAEGFWRHKNDKLLYNIKVEQSAEKNAHIEIAVFDALTGRMIPGFEVETKFFLDDAQVESVKPTLMWHPWLYHYGNNFRVPKRGSYELHVKTSRTDVKRYGKEYGAAFNEAIEHIFTDVDIQTGQK